MSDDLVLRTTITEIAVQRDQALVKAHEAASLLVEGYRLMQEAEVLAKNAHGGVGFYVHQQAQDYLRLSVAFNADASLAAFRKQLDARVWTRVVHLTRLHDLMDRTAREQLEADLRGDVPAFTEEAARQTFGDLLSDAPLIFQRGLARAFSDLDRRFRSHDGFKLGSRIILTRMFDEYGHFNTCSRQAYTLADVERVFAVLDQKTPAPHALADAIRADRRRGWNPQQSVTETPYFRVRCFQNGNAHLWFKRDDLVEKANQVLADYYGAVLPDASPVEDSIDSFRSVGGLPAKDLSFYPTPDPVVEACLNHLHPRPGQRILEPSAGTGNMVRHLLAARVAVDAVEIDINRVRILQAIQHPDLLVLADNFLRMPATALYDGVMMNPPFYGTHWIDHVTHAFNFLKPGGYLVAVLPASAEFGTTKKHEAFRQWAKKYFACPSRPFTDLPLESFATSGTRVSTVILTLCRR